MPLLNRRFRITNVHDDEQEVWDLGNDNLTFGQVSLFVSEQIPIGMESEHIFILDEIDKLDVGEYHYRIGYKYRYERDA